MTKLISRFWAVVFTVLLLATPSARANFGGAVYCDANCTGVSNAPLAGVTVNAYLCGTATLVGSTVTGPDGSYSFEPSPSMPVGGVYYVCAVIPAGYTGGANPGNPGYACTTTCFTFTLLCDCTHNIGLCPINGCSPTIPSPCPPANAFFGLGAAGGFTVLGLSGANVVISEGATLVRGNVGLGPNDTGDLLKAKIDGALILDPTSNPDIHPDLQVTGGIISLNLNPAVNAALAANANLAALASSQTFGDITKSTTLTGNGSVNVISLKSVNMVKGTITITGSSSDVFVFNVAGQFNFSSSQIKLVGVSANNILWNFPVTGTGDINIFKDVTVAYGVFLAPNRNIVIDHTVTTGEVIGGGQIRIHSAATVVCPTL